MNEIAKLIEEELGYPNLLTDLNEKLSGSDLNSFLLELFRLRTMNISPAAVLQQFANNRFAFPSTIDPIVFKELEIKYLGLARQYGFEPLNLSPLAPLGTCSAIGLVDQNKIVSAVRGTEVVSDATNVMALMIAHECRKGNTNTLRYATTHRHVRAQALADPRHTAHFGLFCMVTGGLDRGSFSFEIEQIIEHLQIHLALLSASFDKKDIWMKVQFREENESFIQRLSEQLKTFD